MAAPAFGAAGTQFQGSPGTTVSVDVPDGVVADSVVVVTVFLDGPTSTITGLPSGFAQAPDSPVVGASNKLYVFWKRATGTESTAGTYDYTTSASVYNNAQAIRYTGVTTSGSPWDVTNSAVADTAGTVTPAVSDTTTVADTLLVFAGTNWAGGAWTPPTSFTERRDSGDQVCTVADLAQAAAGSSGSITATCAGSDRRTAWLGALKSDAAAGGVVDGMMAGISRAMPGRVNPGGKVFVPGRPAPDLTPPFTSIEVMFDDAGDLDLFTEELINTSANTITKSFEGNRAAYVSSGAAGSDRRIYLLPAATHLGVNLDVRFRFKTTDVAPDQTQVGLVARVQNRRAPLWWANVVFSATGHLLAGCWQYDGTTLNETNQNATENRFYGLDATVVGDGTTVTVTTTQPHLVEAGDNIQVVSPGLGLDAQFAGTQTIISPTVFTVPNSTAGSSTGYYRWVIAPQNHWTWLRISLRGNQILSRYWSDGHPEPLPTDTLRNATATLPTNLAFGSQTLPVGFGQVGFVLAHAGNGGTLRIDRFQAINLDVPVVAALQDDQRSTATGTVSAGGITGTAAETQDNNTSAASGVLGYTGSVARTQGNNTSAATGVLGYSGTVARTQADNTSAASGQLGYTGTLARTEQDDTCAASGTSVAPGANGTVAETQDNNTSAASGVLGYTGTVSRTQANNTVSASGTFTPSAITGTVAETQDNNTSTASGTVVAPVTGTLARTQADNTCAASGTHVPPPVTGTLVRTQGNNTVAAGGFIGAFETPPQRVVVGGDDERTTVGTSTRTTVALTERRTS